MKLYKWNILFEECYDDMQHDQILLNDLNLTTHFMAESYEDMPKDVKKQMFKNFCEKLYNELCEEYNLGD